MGDTPLPKGMKFYFKDSIPQALLQGKEPLDLGTFILEDEHDEERLARYLKERILNNNEFYSPEGLKKF